ncbi:putative retrotransposon hot spot (RHS) protein [Trypanosoma cruzi]|nr:putative retrotransposon hot spot (RHS) protein [Trypanosoma cruzi]
MKKDDNVAVLGLVARLCSSEGGGPRLLHQQALQCGCMAHRQPCRASATPNAIGTAGGTAATVLWSQRHLLAAVGRCEWDASPHGCCDGALQRLRCWFRRCNLQRSKERPQWTLDSLVEDVLLDGDTLNTKMKLNDFLRRKLGDE